MTFAIEMYFDSESEMAVRRIWAALAEAGIDSAMLAAGYRPHVSLGVCAQLNTDGLRRDLAVWTKSVAPLSLSLSSVGIFPAPEVTLFLGATVTRQLLHVHTAFHRIFKAHAQSPRVYYQPGHWIPHCTLAFGLSIESLVAAVEFCQGISLPVDGRIEQIGIAKVSPSSAEELFLYDLSSS